MSTDVWMKADVKCYAARMQYGSVYSQCLVSAFAIWITSNFVNVVLLWSGIRTWMKTAVRTYRSDGKVSR